MGFKQTVRIKMLETYTEAEMDFRRVEWMHLAENRDWW
jgi:hypothetical protein